MAPAEADLLVVSEPTHFPHTRTNVVTVLAAPLDIKEKEQIPAGVKVSFLVGGGFHVLARTSTGHVLGWGFNDRGQVGDGTTTNRFQPVPVTLPGDATVKALAAGSLHSVALTIH